LPETKKENFEQIKKKLKIVDNKEVKIVGVTKNRTYEEVEGILEKGLTDLGENRVQELMSKAEMFTRSVNWHFIGHLQRNKVKYVVRIPQLAMIHSVDSLRLAKKVSQEARRVGRRIPVLLQVNIAREEQKYGFSKQELLKSLDELDELENIEVKGLMAMAPFVSDPEETRIYFADLRKLSENVKEREWNRIEMKELSMGMSQDYLVAIEEGATIIRLGRVLFSEEGGIC